MANRAKKKAQKPKPKPLTTADLDLDPNAWPKFVDLIKRAAKMGHKPHKQKDPSK
jgi:hypothetical protein